MVKKKFRKLVRKFYKQARRVRRLNRAHPRRGGFRI